MEQTTFGNVEMIRALRTTRHSAVKAITQAINHLRSLLVSAPEELRHRLRALSIRELVAACARFRPGTDPAEVQTATKFALRSVARRYRQLCEEIAELDEQLDRLVADAAPELISLVGVGTDHAATLLIVAGDNSQLLKSEASFASLCGVSPIEASSGKVVRHRLNRGGDRYANRALHLICVVRMECDLRPREYVARRTREGKSKREIMRCLKRYIAREVYRLRQWIPKQHRRGDQASALDDQSVAFVGAQARQPSEQRLPDQSCGVTTSERRGLDVAVGTPAHRAAIEEAMIGKPNYFPHSSSLSEPSRACVGRSSVAWRGTRAAIRWTICRIFGHCVT